MELRGEGVWRYLPWLPVDEPVTLGEPTTPLVRLPWDGIELTLKLEGAQPSGSFKDRGAALLVAWLAEHGVARVVEDSSGNAGAALAAYAARAGIACEIHVPADLSPAKLVQIEAYGARPVRVRGPRPKATESVIAAAEAGAVYASHSYNPLYLAGTQTFAFELWEQLGRRAPDALAMPVGGGALLLGAHRGFAALHAAGLVDRVPRLIAVQSTAAAPLVASLRAGAPVALELGETIAEGIRNGDPVRVRALLDALVATGGTAVAVDDGALRAALERLARAGLLVETTAAIAVAALRCDGVVRPGEELVVAITGNGLKSAA